jgi:hypothetical protein
MLVDIQRKVAPVDTESGLDAHGGTDADPSRFRTWVATEAKFLEEIGPQEEQLETIKAELQQTPHHLRWNQRPEEKQFHRLAPRHGHGLSRSGH